MSQMSKRLQALEGAKQRKKGEGVCLVYGVDDQGLYCNFQGRFTEQQIHERANGAVSIILDGQWAAL